MDSIKKWPVLPNSKIRFFFISTFKWKSKIKHKRKSLPSSIRVWVCISEPRRTCEDSLAARKGRAAARVHEIRNTSPKRSVWWKFHQFQIRKRVNFHFNYEPKDGNNPKRCHFCICYTETYQWSDPSELHLVQHWQLINLKSRKSVSDRKCTRRVLLTFNWRHWEKSLCACFACRERCSLGIVSGHANVCRNWADCSWSFDEWGSWSFFQLNFLKKLRNI